MVKIPDPRFKIYVHQNHNGKECRGWIDEDGIRLDEENGQEFTLEQAGELLESLDYDLCHVLEIRLVRCTPVPEPIK